MKLYLDICCLNRPFDDLSQARLLLESQAILAILAECETGVFTLVSSEVLAIENDVNPFPQKKAFVDSVLASSSLIVMINSSSERRALELESRGFKAFDALHVAVAESAAADYFCTCDDRLLSKTRIQTDLTVNVRSPLQLTQEIFS